MKRLSKKYEDFLDLVFYQIYPRSFMDANNDGVGDFRGIIEKVPYLAELGVNAVWISPFFQSPNDDNGYDISDYREVGAEYGTKADLRELVDTLHRYGMKVIFDLVVNHTSTAHKWFCEARKSKDNPYRDYYYWADEPLNDWESSFGGPAWEFDAATGQYYLHSFAVTQADLNWENPAVREEVKRIIDYWVDFGVDGFRCDVLDLISKRMDDPDGNYGGPHLHEYIREMFGREKTAHLYTVGECWSVNEKDLEAMCAEERGELTASFLFSGSIHHYEGLYEPVKPRFADIHDYYTKYTGLTQDRGLIFAPFFENHDRGRAVSAFAPAEKRYEAATFFATILGTSRGTPFIYQGQEFGTPDPVYHDFDAFNDVETRNFHDANVGRMPDEELLEKMNFRSRDNGRHPMIWSGSVNGGFNRGAEPWLCLHSDCEKYSLEADKAKEADGKSVFAFYKKILALRKKSPALRRGRFDDLTGEREDCFLFTRTEGDEKLLVVANYENPSVIPIPDGAKLLLSNNPARCGAHFAPFETAIYQLP